MRKRGGGSIFHEAFSKFMKLPYEERRTWMVTIAVLTLDPKTDGKPAHLESFNSQKTPKIFKGVPNAKGTSM